MIAEQWNRPSIIDKRKRNVLAGKRVQRNLDGEKMANESRQRNTRG